MGKTPTEWLYIVLEEFSQISQKVKRKPDGEVWVMTKPWVQPSWAGRFQSPLMETKEQAWGGLLGSSEPWVGLVFDPSLFISNQKLLKVYFGFCLEEGNTTSIKELLSNAFNFYGGSPLYTEVPHLQEGRFFFACLKFKK